MKMGDRRLKRLDRLGVQIQNKTRLTGEPTNRAEKRRFNHVLRQERVKADEIDQVALFATIKNRHSK